MTNRDVRVPTCPQCGAPVKVSAGRCEYCQAEFIVTSLSSLDGFDKAGTDKYVNHYKQLLRDNPDDGELNYAMGICYLDLGLCDLAIRYFAKAVEGMPDNADAYYYYALAQLKGKRPKVLTLAEIRKIEEYLSAAIKIDDARSKYYYLWALIKHDFYRCNGLTMKPPSVEALIDEGKRKPYDDAEIKKMLDRIQIGDGDLVSLVRNGNVGALTCPQCRAPAEGGAGKCPYCGGVI